MTPDQNQTPAPQLQMQPASPQPMQPTQQSYPMMPPPQAPAKSRKVWLFSAIAAVVVLIIGAVVAYFLMFSPAAQAAKATKKFMNAASAGKTDEMITLTNATTSDEKAFITGIAENLKGSYKLTQKTSQSGKYYYLYDLTGAKRKYARTIVEKEDGKWRVNNIVTGDAALALIPGSASSTTQATDTSSPSPSPAATTTSALSCLAQADYKYMNYDKSTDTVKYDTTYSTSYPYTSNKTDDMFFEPDSTTEKSFVSVYDDWADFAKHASDKQWKFRLEGSVYGTGSALASSKKLANDRAAKVTSQLVSRGVPADRIVVDTPHDYTNEPQDSSSAEIYRRVQIVVDPTCTASSSTTGR